MSLTAERRKSSQQGLSICGNSNTAGKTFLMKLVERMPRVCKAVIKAKGCYKIYLDWFKTVLVTT
jgi:hypothetical protein